MKKLIIICVLICLLFAAYESRIELPPADNTTLAEELITHTYSDADLASIGENYDNILDLARDYKIECIRDPREFFENYLPYIVLMSNTGKRAFVYFDAPEFSYDKGSIAFCLLTDEFKSYDEMYAILDDMVNNGTTWERVYAMYDQYNTGESYGGRGMAQSFAVKEGVFITAVYFEKEPAFSKINYYSDEEIFCLDVIEREYSLAHTIKPLLTIDKNW
jgi:hypothetical protein